MTPKKTPNAPKPTAPSRRRRKDERPGEIAAAALKVFAETGFAAARLEDVAERAGTSKGTIYLYYPTKEALFEAVVRDTFAPVLRQSGQAVLNPQMTCEEVLRFVIGTMYREIVGTERREIMRLLIAESGRFPSLVEFYHREVISRGKELMKAVLARGVAAGEFRRLRALEHPEVVMAPVVLASLWTLVFQRVEPLNLEHYIEAHLELVLNALRATDPN